MSTHSSVCLPCELKLGVLGHQGSLLGQAEERISVDSGSGPFRLLLRAESSAPHALAGHTVGCAARRLWIAHLWAVTSNYDGTHWPRRGEGGGRRLS